MKTNSKYCYFINRSDFKYKNSHMIKSVEYSRLNKSKAMLLIYALNES